MILVLALGSAKGQNTMEKAKALMESGNENQALEMLDAMQSQEPEYLNLLGEIWLKKGNSEKAVTYFEQAKDKLERTGSADRRLLGQTYNNIAVALWSQGKNSQALQYHQVALQNRETLKDPRKLLHHSTTLVWFIVICNRILHWSTMKEQKLFMSKWD